jgi:F420-non-reducing hydrogenase small subunit
MTIWWRKLRVKPKFLIATLTSCSGCIGIIPALDIFPEWLERIDLVYFPFLLDETEIEENDVALVEGCVSEETQINLLHEIRKKSKKVIALGTCAAFGGILALSTEKQAEPISNYIEIDGFIPGCPPPSKLLGNSLIRLLENKPIELSDRNLCANCPLHGETEISYKHKIQDLAPKKYSAERTTCFLKDGILCLGPVTREGCECQCIEAGQPCEGCMGPISQDFTSNLVNYLSILKLSKDLRRYEGIFFRFSKPRIKMREKS